MGARHLRVLADDALSLPAGAEPVTGKQHRRIADP